MTAVRLEQLVLERVKYMPRDLAPGILYVSEEFAIAGHLCACGCGEKVMTPLGPTEWQFSERRGSPSLWPSIGNWQLPCRSHYVIRDGRIIWSGQWTDAQVASGRAAEERRRQAYYAERQRERVWWRRLWRWLRGLVGG
jgi:hypothetical protein